MTSQGQEKKFNFTNNRLDKLENDSSKRLYFFDTGCPGLQLCITPAGSMSFRLHGWDNQRKKTVQIVLGKYPELQINKAREIVRLKIQEMSEGQDVVSNRNAIKTEATLDDLFDIWVAEYEPDNISNVKDARVKYTRHIQPSFGKRKATAITDADIRKWRSRMLKMKKLRGGGTLSRGFVQRVFTLLSSIYSNAAPKIYNPCSDVVGCEPIKRDVFLKTDHLQIFFKQLDDPSTPEYLRDFFILSLATRARRSNVLAMKWNDIDLNLNIWVIQGKEAKKKKLSPFH